MAAAVCHLWNSLCLAGARRSIVLGLWRFGLEVDRSSFCVQSGARDTTRSGTLSIGDEAAAIHPPAAIHRRSAGDHQGCYGSSYFSNLVYHRRAMREVSCTVRLASTTLKLKKQAASGNKLYAINTRLRLLLELCLLGEIGVKGNTINALVTRLLKWDEYRIAEGKE